MSDSFEVQLKPTQETFVDEPTALEDVSIDELTFDLQHNIKDINKLHVFHALSIFRATLEDIITVQSDENFEKYRKASLEKCGMSVDDELFRPSTTGTTGTTNTGSRNGSTSSSSGSGIGSSSSIARGTSISTPPQRSETPPPCSPPLKFARLNDNNFNEISIKETTPDSLDQEYFGSDSNDYESKTDQDQQQDDEGGHDDNQTNESDNVPPPYISIEQLVSTFNFKDSLEQNVPFAEQLEQELSYNSSPKIKEQNMHILKCFGLAKKPSLSIEEFLVRLQTYSPSISVSVYVHAAYMMYKLCILLNVVQLTELNVYRFILASIRCSIKKLEDVYQKQKVFATIGGVSQKDLFKIEVGFLYLTNFKVVVDEKILQNYLKDTFVSLREFTKENY